MGILFLMMILATVGGFVGLILAGTFHILVVVTTWIENPKPSRERDWD